MYWVVSGELYFNSRKHESKKMGGSSSKLYDNVMSSCIALTVTQGDLQLAADDAELVAAEYDDDIYVGDATAGQKQLVYKSDIRWSIGFFDKSVEISRVCL